MISDRAVHLSCITWFRSRPILYRGAGLGVLKIRRNSPGARADRRRLFETPR